MKNDRDGAPTIAIRRATDDDEAAITAVINAAYRVEAFFIDGDRTTPAEVRARLARDAFLVAVAGGRVAGCVHVEVRGSRGHFGLLAVDPERRGAGLGRRLVDAAEDFCREAGCTQMDLHVVNLRTELPGFYRSLGYVETGTEPFAVGVPTKLPCHFLTMAKPLFR